MFGGGCVASAIAAAGERYMSLKSKEELKRDSSKWNMNNQQIIAILIII